jgi:putative salt-induced outer membrane protein YdiY
MKKWEIQMIGKIGRSMIGAAILGLFSQMALAQATSSPDFKAGYEAGYKAAMESMKAGSAVPPPTSAQAAAVAPAASPAQQGSDEPRDWWNHSALLYPDLEPAWRHHAELQFSASGLSGNDSGHAVRGSAKLFSRSDRWTNELVASIDKRNIVQAGGVVNRRDYKMLQDSVRYDLTTKLYTSAGFIMERDDVNLIDRRNTVLAGFGYYVFDNPTMRLNTFIGLGKLNETYLAPVPALTGLTSRDSGLVYLYQTFDWQLSRNWSLQQGFRQIRDLDESGRYVPATSGPTPYFAAEMVKRYRNVSNLSLNYQLSPRSALSLGIESRYDSNPWPDVKSRDTTKRLSLNLMY